MGWLEDSQSARRKEIEAEQQQQPATKKHDEKIDFLLRDHVQQPKKKKENRSCLIEYFLVYCLLSTMIDLIFLCVLGECTDGAGRDSARDLMYI